jgi:hypothetical protein
MRAADHVGALLFCAEQQRFVEYATRERQCGEGQRRFNQATFRGQAHGTDGLRDQSDGVDSGQVKIVEGFAAQEFAADFVVRPGLALQQGNVAAGGGQPDGQHGPGKTPADDQMLGAVRSIHCGLLRETHRRAGLKASIL